MSVKNGGVPYIWSPFTKNINFDNSCSILQTWAKPVVALQTPLWLFINWFIHSVSHPLVQISLERRHSLTVENGAFSHEIDYVTGGSKSWRASKLHDWYKSYSDFAEWEDFSCWWSCIGKGVRAACKAGLFHLHIKHIVGILLHDTLKMYSNHSLWVFLTIFFYYPRVLYKIFLLFLFIKSHKIQLHPKM